MAYNQYNAPRQPDIPRLSTEDIVTVLYDMKYTQYKTDKDIIKWLTVDSGYNYGHTHAYTLLRDTYEYRKELIDKLYLHDVKACLSELEALKQDALKEGNKRLALDCQKEINKVAGHYKERIEVNGDMTFKVKWGN